MKTALQKQLAKIAPSLSIRTLWGHDPHSCQDIRKECDGFDDENPDDWTPWQSEIRVTVICDGEEVTASDYMGGTWEKADAVPEESNPTISGYEPQMTQQAIDDLRQNSAVDLATLDELGAASLWLNEFMRAEHEKQRAEIESGTLATVG